jgi:hypothetical protein
MSRFMQKPESRHQPIALNGVLHAEQEQPESDDTVAEDERCDRGKKPPPIMAQQAAEKRYDERHQWRKPAPHRQANAGMKSPLRES